MKIVSSQIKKISEFKKDKGLDGHNTNLRNKPGGLVITTSENCQSLSFSQMVKVSQQKI